MESNQDNCLNREPQWKQLIDEYCQSVQSENNETIDIIHQLQDEHRENEELLIKALKERDEIITYLLKVIKTNNIEISNETRQKETKQKQIINHIKRIVETQEELKTKSIEYFQRLENNLQSPRPDYQKEYPIELHEKIYEEYYSTRKEIISVLDSLKILSQSTENFIYDIHNIQTKLYIKQLSVEAGINNEIDSIVSLLESKSHKKVDNNVNEIEVNDSDTWKSKLIKTEEDISDE